MSVYRNLIGVSTPYAKRMNRLSNRIFGDILTPNDAKSKRIVYKFKEKPFYKEDHIVNYYPRHLETGRLMQILRDCGLYRDEHLDFKDEMSRLRKLRGKVKPKKGGGKQALNR